MKAVKSCSEFVDCCTSTFLFKSFLKKKIKNCKNKVAEVFFRKLKTRIPELSHKKKGKLQCGEKNVLVVVGVGISTVMYGDMASFESSSSS